MQLFKVVFLSPLEEWFFIGCAAHLSAARRAGPCGSHQWQVLANHAPMMSALDTGVLRYKERAQVRSDFRGSFAIHGR